jgi:hypothetical protein
VDAAVPESGFQCRAVCATTALHFPVLCHELGVSNVEPHGLALGFKAETTLALALCGDPIIGQVAFNGHACNLALVAAGAKGRARNPGLTERKTPASNRRCIFKMVQMSGSLSKPNPTGLIDPQAQRIVEFLTEMGLPSDNIIAAQNERALIGNNLHAIIDEMPQEAKRDARYLSKFVVGAGVGLFDYSLNAIWNEVVIDLRKKAVMYGLDIFFDAAVGGSRNRDFYQTEDDLASIKDAVLLDTCRKLEIIQDTLYKKLKHILDMRNDVGISHPTSYNIGAFELLSWLQTCVKEVLNDRPTEAALQVQAFISNLRAHTDPIDANTQKTIELRISQLATHLCGSLLRTVFGIFVAPDTHPTVRKNISLLAPKLWSNCADEPKYKLGLVLEGYKSNLHKEKYDLGGQFFEVVGGNSYRTEAERAVIVDGILTELKEKTDGWDNFHHEPPVASLLSSYVASPADILPNFADKLFKTVLICRIGRGIPYNSGVAPRAKPYYDQILELAGDRFAATVMAAMTHYEVQSKLSRTVAREQAKQALQAVRKNVINARLAECLDYLIVNIEAFPGCALSPKFKELTADVIVWR